MRKGLPRRMHELQEAAALLQKHGWIVTGIGLTAEDDGDRGMHPYGTLTVRYDPLKRSDVL